LKPDRFLDLRLTKALVSKLFSRQLLLELLRLLELLLRLKLLLRRLEPLLWLELLLRLLELLLRLLELLLGLELLLRLLELLLGLELLLPLGLLQESWLDGLLGLLLLGRKPEELLLLLLMRLLRLESTLGRLDRLAERLLLLEQGGVRGVGRVDEGVEVLASSAGRD